MNATGPQEAKNAGLRYVSDSRPGIVRRRRGKGFVYFDHANGQRMVKDPDTLNRIQKLVIPPAWENVWICPDPKGHIQAIGRDAKGRKQYRYHERFREVRDLNKFQHILDFGAALPKIRRAVLRDLKLESLPKRKMCATVVKLLDDTCIRVGNNEYARDNESYGLTTLKDEHVTVQRGGKIRFQFRGKSGVERDCCLTDPKLAKIVKKSQDLPGEELFQYKDENGEFKPLDSSDVNDYLRDISGEDFTAKDFRTWHGTVHALMELAAAGPAETETETKRHLATAVKNTASKLANRPATCRSYYIHPAVLEGYTDQALFRVVGSGVQNLKMGEKLTLMLVKQFYKTRKN